MFKFNKFRWVKKSQYFEFARRASGVMALTASTLRLKLCFSEKKTWQFHGLWILFSARGFHPYKNRCKPVGVKLALCRPSLLPPK